MHVFMLVLLLQVDPVTYRFGMAFTHKEDCENSKKAIVESMSPSIQDKASQAFDCLEMWLPKESLEKQDTKIKPDKSRKSI